MLTRFITLVTELRHKVLRLQAQLDFQRELARDLAQLAQLQQAEIARLQSQAVNRSN